MKFKIKNKSLKKFKRQYELIAKLKNENDILEFYASIRKKNPNMIHIHQDQTYFNWRIEKSPLNIEKVFLYENQTLLGYYYLTNYPKYCEITDLTFIDDKSGNILLRKLAATVQENNIKFLYYTYNAKNLLNQKVSNQLKKFGFLIMKGPNHFVLRNFTHQEGDKFFKIENWYINNLWSEGI